MWLTSRPLRNPARKPGGQSLIEFAVLLPSVLILILLIVRMMMILNVWYTVTQTANIAVRAAALTGDTLEACKIATENLPGFSPDRLRFKIRFGATQEATCFFTVTQTNLQAVPIVGITITPMLPTFVPPITPSPTPFTVTPAPGTRRPPTRDPLEQLDPARLADSPIRVEIVYDIQIAGPLIPAWTIRLTASATSRLETRLRVIPTATPDFF